MDLSVFLALIGVILLGLAAFGVSLPRVHFGWLGLALIWLAVAVIGHVDLH